MKIAGKEYGPNRTFVIAEAGSNHDGSYAKACALIDAASRAGADAVKFQTFRASHLYPENAGNAKYLGRKKGIYSIIKEMEMPYSWLPRLARYAAKRNILFLSTPFDEASADALERVGVQAYKTGSYELTHLPLLAHLARKRKLLIISTGMATLAEVREAVETVERNGNPPLALLHCVAAYPAPLKDTNLLAMKAMGTAFNVAYGLSDHSADPVKAPGLAAALGATIIEKHFTLARAKGKGPDHAFAIEPDELTLLVKEVRRVNKLTAKQKQQYVKSKPYAKTTLGSPVKRLTASERELAAFAKRWIYSVRNVRAGERFTEENVRVLRSGKNPPGLHPRYWGEVLGKRAAKAIGKGVPLERGHLE
ncbi:MAG: N-acetylneuraminate synthase family protein [Candidatus Micrarchaeia archaeon]